MRIQKDYSSGYGLLELLMPEGLNLTQRDAAVAATVIQWLGTNCGFGFYTNCLRKVGERVVRIDDTFNTRENPRPEDQYYSRHSDFYRNLHASAWYNLMQENPEVEPLRELLIKRRSLAAGKGIAKEVYEKRREARREVMFERRDDRLSGGFSDVSSDVRGLASASLRATYDKTLSDRGYGN